ncbi:ATP-binding cassette domain-containing protein [Nocardia puris]|uniref:ABC transporter ATP-binding protein n=1 Tax=Nocardia puris TaxID=208602 RepID=UPI00189523DC|nr:ATP-binding cassette domain-containing protein [Nocardia puris]MBF6364510.1 ATP-binding cassette domain-containing protein [Nocardia puris]MBF6459439.1 ATP-binding cassette domain-containing protein [Nocardia puris]
MTAARQVLAARGLGRRFEMYAAVTDVSFSVAAGSVAALVGPAGAGKTTLVRMLLGLLEPTSGSAEVAGRTIPATISDDPREDAAAQVGGMLVPRGLHPARGARDHLLVYAAAVNVPDTRVDAVLETVGLTDAARIAASALSVGQQTRLALATALLTDPQLLILDEPTEGLDGAERGWLHDFLRRHARRGGSALLTARSLAAVVPMSDQLIVLCGGSVVYQGTPATLRRGHPDRLVVASSSPVALATALAARGHTDAVIRPDGRLAVAETTEAQLHEAAAAAGVRLDSVTPDPIHPDRVLASLVKPAAPPVLQGAAVHRPPTPYGIPR